ncbi:MAG: sulfurtransferase [Pseudomonadota bacterium]
MIALPPIAEPGDLAQVLDQSGLIILDLRAEENYLHGHIPNALPFELGEIVQSEPPLGGLLPTEEQMSSALSRIGFTGNEHIVAVDDNGGPQAARLVWTLEAFGIDRASMINGGMAAWKAEIEAIDQTPETAEPQDYRARYQGRNVLNRQDLMERLDDATLQIIDARSAGEYRGEDVRSARGGHIPGAIHLEWTELKDPCQLKFRPLNEIQAVLDHAGITRDKDCVAYCQTHMRSSVVCVALRALGYDRVMGYPGAWSDWGNCEDTPVE